MINFKKLIVVSDQKIKYKNNCMQAWTWYGDNIWRFPIETYNEDLSNYDIGFVLCSVNQLEWEFIYQKNIEDIAEIFMRMHKTKFITPDELPNACNLIDTIMLKFEKNYMFT